MPLVTLWPHLRHVFARVRTLNDGGHAPTEFVLFATGNNPGDDGAAIFDEQAARACMKTYKERGVVRLTIDYNHKSIDPKAPPEDQKAAGWFTPVVRYDAQKQPSLWATNVNWTDAARSGIEKKEWLYISPVFSKDDDDRVVAIVNLAITNNPASWGARPLVAASLGGFSRMKPEIVMLYACLLSVAAGGDPAFAPVAAEALEKMKVAAGDQASALEAEAQAALTSGGETTTAETETVAAAATVDDTAARVADMPDASEEEKRAARGLNVDAALLLARAAATPVAPTQSKRAADITAAEKEGLLPKNGPVAVWARTCSDVDFATYVQRAKESGVKIRMPAAKPTPSKDTTDGTRGKVDTSIDKNVLRSASQQAGVDADKLAKRIVANREKSAKEGDK